MHLPGEDVSRDMSRIRRHLSLENAAESEKICLEPQKVQKKFGIRLASEKLALC